MSNSSIAVASKPTSDALEDVLSQRHLPALDGIRAVAVGLVMVFHYGLAPVSGGLGVNAFFVLSGFLITWLLLAEFRSTQTLSFRNFYIRRTLRIFPAYYCFLGLFFILSAAKHDVWPPGNRLAAVSYLMDWYMSVHIANVQLIHLWSLAIEEHFYLLWPVLFLWMARRGCRTLVVGLLAIISAGVAWRFVAFVGLGLGAGYPYYAFEARCDNLAIGCLLAVVLNYSKQARAAASSLASASWKSGVTLLFLVVQSRIDGAYRATVGYTVEALLIALLLVQILQRHRDVAWRWLDTSPLKFLGRLSYSLYLYHSLGESVALRIPDAPHVIGELAAVPISLVLAAGSYYLVEQPFLKWKDRFVIGQPIAIANSAPAIRASAASSEVGA